jgi:hypothetical protein
VPHAYDITISDVLTPHDIGGFEKSHCFQKVCPLVTIPITFLSGWRSHCDVCKNLHAAATRKARKLLSAGWHARAPIPAVAGMGIFRT